MKTLIIYHSEHHGNTKEVAEVIAEVLDADLFPSNQKIDSLNLYDLVGFGSGIYYGKFHEDIYRLIENLPYQNAKNCFIFSTAGSKSYSLRGHSNIKEELNKKGFNIAGEFSCLGYDTALTAKGINHGRPDKNDLILAKNFAYKFLK